MLPAAQNSILLYEYSPWYPTIQATAITRLRDGSMKALHQDAFAVGLGNPVA